MFFLTRLDVIARWQGEALTDGWGRDPQGERSTDSRFPPLFQTEQKVMSFWDDVDQKRFSRGDWEHSMTSVHGHSPPHPHPICIHYSSLALGRHALPLSLSIVCFSDLILGNWKYRPICCPTQIFQKAKFRFDFHLEAKVSPSVDLSEALGKQVWLDFTHICTGLDRQKEWYTAAFCLSFPAVQGDPFRSFICFSFLPSVSVCWFGRVPLGPQSEAAVVRWLGFALAKTSDSS